MPPRHTFEAEPTSTSLDRIALAQQEVDDLVVLSLVSVFERRIRDHLAALPWLSTPSGTDVDERTRRQIVADMEYWKLSSEVLVLFSNRVSGNVIGQVRQVINYRDWVAHGRSADRRPSNVIPRYAFKILTEFLSQAGLF
jgi:hypothetical protein